MNKYDVRLPDNNISLYFNSINEVLNFCNKNFNDLLIPITEKDITLDNKLLYMKYINEIINNSNGNIYIKNKKHHLYKSNKGLIPIHLYEQNGFYMDGCQYIKGIYDKNSNSLKSFEGEYTYSFGWIMSRPKEFLSIFSNNNQLQFIEYSFRKYGQPKLSKPKELKGIKQVFSINYNAKCKCQIFIKDNNVWIKHRDYFSPLIKNDVKDIGTPLSYRVEKYLGKKVTEKFIYADTWGDIVLRSEAWICIKNLLYRLKVNESEIGILEQILRQQEKLYDFHYNELEIGDMSRFWEDVIKKCIKHINN